MDIQLRFDDRIDVYPSKYMTKAGMHVNIQFGMETATEHTAGRKIRIVEAIYDILGFHKHRSSRGVIYFDTTLPGYEQHRQLVSLDKLAQLDNDSTDIYVCTHVEKYQDRDLSSSYHTEAGFSKRWVVHPLIGNVSWV